MKTLASTCLVLLCAASCIAQVTWTAPAATVAASATGNDHPRVAFDRAGDPLVLWGHASRVMFSRKQGTIFSAPVMVNSAARQMASASWMGPDLATHGDTVYIVMKQIPEASDTCRLWCARSYDGGKTFSAPVQVDTQPGIITRFPAITTDESGNPIIAFMKFDLSFGNSRWAVTRSTDGGRTFSTDAKASGWSSPKSVVCDCCPGTVVSSGATVAVVYRDNNQNIRDSWAGYSTDNGATFTRGMNVDENYWSVNACPASGPSAVILGDSLYAVFMSAASGTTLVYRSVSPIDGTGTAQTVPMTPSIPGLTGQNYPRIARSGNAAAIVWVQTINGATQVAMLFTPDITRGFPASYEVIATNNAVNADVALHNGSITVIWEDDNAGVIRQRAGTYPAPPTAVSAPSVLPTATAYPNPVTTGEFRLRLPGIVAGMVHVTVTDLLGRPVINADEPITDATVRLSLNALPVGIYRITTVAGGTRLVSSVVRE